MLSDTSSINTELRDEIIQMCKDALEKIGKLEVTCAELHLLIVQAPEED